MTISEPATPDAEPARSAGGRGKWHKVECGAGRFRLSAHGGLGETVEMVKKIVSRRGKNLEMVVLTHGTQGSKREAARHLMPFSDSVVFGNIGTIVSL